jgi:protein SEY1
MNILKRLADAGQEPATAPERQREMKLQPKSTRNSSSYSKVTSPGSFNITTLEIGPEYSNLVAQ